MSFVHIIQNEEEYYEIRDFRNKLRDLYEIASYRNEVNYLKHHIDNIDNWLEEYEVENPEIKDRKYIQRESCNYSNEDLDELSKAVDKYNRHEKDI